MSGHPRIARDQVVLITGGTRGIGLATAEVFAAHGAQTVLTYKWGSADDAEVSRRIVAAGGPEPLLVQADIGREEDTVALVDLVKERFGRVDTFVSNASAALVVNAMDDYAWRGFLKSMQYAAWPAFGYLRAMKAQLGRYPKYVVIMSSDGPDRFTPGYDFVAAAKAVTETLTRYLAYRLRDDDVRIKRRAVACGEDRLVRRHLRHGVLRVPPNVRPRVVGDDTRGGWARGVRALQRPVRRRERAGDHGRPGQHLRRWHLVHLRASRGTGTLR
ncbi:MAG: SDR family oxidoreductase [Vicinamibacterales bacterium]